VAEQYLFWILLLGIVLGVAGAWFVIGRVPRRSDDTSPEELRAEADWISRTINRRGGVAPVGLVEEVLELHQGYMTGEPLEVQPARSQAPADRAAQADHSPSTSTTTAVARAHAPRPNRGPDAPTTTPPDAAPAESTTRQAGEPQGR
jgi:hypothetical protein